MGLSPAALGQAYLDWLTHLAFSPGKRLQLVDKAVRKAIRLSSYAYRCAMESGRAGQCIEPLLQDRRFAGEDWQKWPYNFIYQSFLLNQQRWHNATTDIRGVSKQHETMVEFMSRQMLDMFSPSNFPLTSSDILQHTLHEGGANLDDRFHETTQLHLGLSVHGMRLLRASHMIRTLEALAASATSWTIGSALLAERNPSVSTNSRLAAISP